MSDPTGSGSTFYQTAPQPPEPVTPIERVHIDELLRSMAQQQASDIHLKVGRPPVFRIHGELIPQTAYAPLRTEDMERLYRQLTTPSQRARFEQELELDLPYELEGVARFRVNIAKQRNTITIVMRRLSLTIPSLEELRLPEICKELVMRPRGLILVTGPTGSGKSTTLAAMIDYLNEREARRVVTIEDPIEYVFEDKKCFVTQRELGEDTPSFASALKHALRQDPDVILVGEMRDLETISAALTAAETGHLVLSTLHTAGAALTVDRIVDVFPPHQQQQVRIQLANILVGILSQTLLPLVNGQGRVVAVEVMVATPAVRNLIRESKTHQLPGVIETSQRLGMQTLDQALLALYQQGLVSLEDVLARAADPEHLRNLLSGPTF
ncbi:MAG: type IV pilus twitching motility protein PilT [Anaerolineae bacterium]|nr:type IV pilus twitching motility protein PilT [Anaerolineae bacterium]